MNEGLLLSPGTYTKKMCNKADKIKCRRRLLDDTITFKKRRKQLKEQRHSSNSCLEIREGPTYQSGIDMEVLQQDTTEIPSNCPAPTATPIQATDNIHLMYFDLETTGLGKLSFLHVPQFTRVFFSRSITPFM